MAPMLAELFIGQWLLRLSQRVMGGDDENVIQPRRGFAMTTPRRWAAH
ncbi:Uncharacterised protein [Klebsiella pneumoniae]|uniref:Uncharacterized protein n=1 Tax=Klebsiella pneumoniae TaxID=573 RepID=A0A2X3GGH8_KLEPN|nr:Uncharacterised protein [Klebsiella pneumoniae]